MKISTIKLIAIALLLLPFTNGFGQVIENPKMSDFSWLAGNWIGDGFGGVSQETWTEPTAGSMIGAYKHYRGDQVTFYEIMQIAKMDGKLSLRLKHFNPDLTGWEEKDKFLEFKFVNATPTKIAFKGLVYELMEEGKMEVRLKMNRGGEITTEVFHFEKKMI